MENQKYPFAAFITNLGKYNEGYLIGEWVSFPVTNEEMQKAFKRIGINEYYEEWFISDYDCNVPGIYEALGEYEDLSELNYLANLIVECQERGEQHKLEAILERGEDTANIKEFINLIRNIDQIHFLPGVKNPYDLGCYWIEKSGVSQARALKPFERYFDYESLGMDISLEEGGIFSGQGYFYLSNEPFMEYYDGEIGSIPEEYRIVDPLSSNRLKPQKNHDMER